MLDSGDDSFVDLVLIRVECGLFPIHSGNLLPQGLGTLTAAITDVEGEDLASRGVHRNPDPVAVLLRANKAPQLVRFRLEPLEDHRPGLTLWLDMEMLGSRLKPLDHELQEPPEPDAHRAAAPAQRDSFQQKSFNHRPLFLRNGVIFWITDKGLVTQFAAVILFSGMDVTISFIPCGATLETYFSYDHRTRSGLPLPISVLAKSSRKLTRALLGSHHPFVWGDERRCPHPFLGAQRRGS